MAADAQRLLLQVAETLGLSARGYHRLLKVARTIADLDGLEEIGVAQIGEAASYRPNTGALPAGPATSPAIGL